ncbi:MAG: hypothetical protein PUE01_06085 [Clostridiaceae bacterium]|nr:hypothetical protein [Clostridiaceae bacterium]
MIYKNLKEYIKKLQVDNKFNDKVFIFGAGWVGKLVENFIREDFKGEITFLDNNKALWNKNKGKVNNPDILKNISIEETRIIVASFDNTEEISNQLKGYGLEENIHFFIPLRQLKDIAIEKLKDTEKKNLLIMGDSVMSIISHEDQDIRTLYKMIEDNVTDESVNGFYFPACHLGIHYLVTEYLVRNNKAPKKIILPINMASFSSYWDINPKCENVQAYNSILKLFKDKGHDVVDTYNMYVETTRENFLSYEGEYYGNGILKNNILDYWFNMRPENEDEEVNKYKYICIWLYNYILDIDCRKVRVLRKLINLCKENNIELYPYITPINYELCEKFIGGCFEGFYKKNVEIICHIFSENNIDVYDMSFLVDNSGFVNDKDTVHLNEKGRKILADKVAKVIQG